MWDVSFIRHVWHGYEFKNAKRVAIRKSGNPKNITQIPPQGCFQTMAYWLMLAFQDLRWFLMAIGSLRPSFSATRAPMGGAEGSDGGGGGI